MMRRLFDSSKRTSAPAPFAPQQRTWKKPNRQLPLARVLVALAVFLYLVLLHQLLRSPSSTSVFSVGDEYAHQQQVSFHPVRSNTQLFVTLGSYLLEDNTVVILGVGDFTLKAQRASDAAKKLAPVVPADLQCVYNGKKAASATAHVNGTAYQGVISNTRGALYFGERLLWITCPYDDATTSFVQLTANEGQFDSMPTQVELMLPPKAPEFNLTICTSAVYGLTGSKWITEWIEHHRANGFDSIDMYVHEVGPLVWQVLDYYVQRNTPQFNLRVLNWTSIFDVFDLSTGVGRGVQSEAWEHGQRLTRNDCYLRNRGRSRWIMFSDVDELFSAKQPHGTVSNVISTVCEAAYAEDRDKIACSFSSVTVPPNALAAEEGEERLLLERIDVSENACQSPYNCGRYHYGREKYALRTEFNTMNPHTPLFYHAISRDYELSNKHHTKVDASVAVVRHYAGHFSHSRKGGLAPQRAMYNPISAHIVHEMRVRILNSDPTLRALYLSPSQHETFLKLSRVEDKWRFAKPNELPLPSPPPQVKYLTFTPFKGRLNNQLWTLDWVMRLAMALNRTAVLPTPTEREHFIGFPETPADGSLWDLTVLRKAPFRFVFEWELSEEDRAALLLLPHASDRCVWRYSEQEKYVARWAATRSECDGAVRMHIDSGSGLIHSYKADTRAYGVNDALVFWRYMRLVEPIQQAVGKFISSKMPQHTATLGLHWRTWREANGNAEHATKVCKRLSEKLVLYAGKHLAAQCPCTAKPQQVSPAQMWRSENWFELTCRSASHQSISTYTKLDTNREGFFVTTDHESEEADRVFYGMGAHMIPLQEIAQVQQQLVRGFTRAEAQRYANAIVPILFDLELMLLVDRFVGSPASTLSQAVCLWRRAFNKTGEQVPGMCQLVWSATFSDLCEEMCFK